jgi:RimJ/RimL family protein N-acetyltransferase
MPEVLTQRLRLRPHTKDDADEHLRIISDGEFRRFFPPPPRFQPTRDSVLLGLGRFIEHWYQFGFGVWALELRDGGRFVGYCGLRHLAPTDEVELLYGIDRAFWRTGLTTEAARASLRYGFEHMKFERIMAVTIPENTPSRGVMEKCGLRYERDAFYFDLDVVYYAIDRAGFRPDEGPYELRP